jgi:hypothetical protein
MQHYSCDVTPVGAFGVRVEQAQIGDKVLLVVGGQCGTGGRRARYRPHRDQEAATAWASRNDSIASFALGRWQIDDPLRAATHGWDGSFASPQRP